jgi:hypothetical protein
MRPLLAILIVTIAAASVAAEPVEKVYYDSVEPDGALVGGVMTLPVPVRNPRAPSMRLETETIIDNGPSENRIDVVCVGDGYTVQDLSLYADDVARAVDGFFRVEPFNRYSTFFNVHRVDVISNEPGVDNDPVYGIFRDTAMDMAFWCFGIERLLCVDAAKALDYASNAPDVDHVLALANSTMYGGAGYTVSNLATVSGGNSATIEIALHECGHSLGNLADEYYDNGTIYTRPEPSEPNISTLDGAEMAASGTKWAHWLGDSGEGFDGFVDTYEGAYYFQYGIYRPSINSRMRSLRRPFNLPSVEALVIEFYKVVHPIDEATPTDMTLTGAETVFVRPVEPVGNPLDVRWYLDGEMLTGATADSVVLPTLAIEPGAHLLSATVVDSTPWVRDEAARAQWLTQRVSWDLIVDWPAPTLLEPRDASLLEHTSTLLRWSAVQGATGYRVQVGDPCGVGAVYEAADTSLYIEELPFETNIYWQVASGNGGNYGVYCPCFSFRTPASTAVLVQECVAEVRARDVRIRWRTPLDLRNASFEVYREDASHEAALLTAQPLTSLDGNYEYLDASVRSNQDYEYRIAMRDGPASTIVRTIPVHVGRLQWVLGIRSVRPHPVLRDATITLEVSGPGRVGLDLMDIAGRRIRTLFDGDPGEGLHDVSLDTRRSGSGAPLAAGVYYALLRFNGRTAAKRIVVVP